MTAPLDWQLVPCLADNYAVLLSDPATGATALVDAPEEGPIVEALEASKRRLTTILITHHHHDHVGALEALKARYQAVAIGPRSESDRIAGLDRTVAGGDTLTIGDTSLAVIDVPGHTLGHVAYVGGGVMMAGDALFALGCGRMFEGTPGPMWEGLKRLRAFDDDTLLFCGHEYTASNARFALSVDDENPDLIAYAERVAGARLQDLPTVPSRLGDEKRANPFLRADDPRLAARLGLAGCDPATVFAHLRKAKDSFR